jgi:hypothetical protein
LACAREFHAGNHSFHSEGSGLKKTATDYIGATCGVIAMRVQRFVACCLALFLIVGNASAQIEELEGRARAEQQRPPEQDAGWNLGHTRTISGLDFSPDGKRIVSCSRDHTIRLWDAQTGALVRTIVPGRSDPFLARFTPDGRAILACFSDNTLGLWSVSEGKRLAMIALPAIASLDPLWTPDGSKFVMVESNSNIVVRDRNLHPLRTFRTRLYSVDICGFAQNGRVVICTGQQNAETSVPPFALDIQTGQKVHGWFESKDIVSLSFSPDQRFVLTEEKGGRHVIRNASTGAALLSEGIGPRDSVVFSRDGKSALLIRFVEQYSSNTGQLLSSSTWKPLGPRFDAEYAGGSVLSPDGSLVACVDEQQENRFRLFATTTGKILWASADPFLILGSKPSLALLQQLSQDYTRYGLPLPPDSAQLAYIEPLGPPVTRSKEPGDRILALVEQAGKEKQQAGIYAGFKPEPIDDEEIVVPVQSEQATLQRTKPGDGGYGDTGTADISMAVFCYRRGWSSLGLEFLKRKLEGYRSDVREDFAGAAWSYWENSLIEPTTDRKTAAKYLHLVFDAFKPLRTDHKKSLLADLDLTLKSPTTHHTGIEGEIDALSDTVTKTATWDAAHIHDYDQQSPVLRSLWLQGFEAVPFLLRHIDDRRLAYGEMTGFNMYPSHVMRVGEIVYKLLLALAGMGKIEENFTDELELAQRTSAEQWWKRAQAMGEERYLVANILPAKNTDQDWPNAHNAVMVAHKYPNKLPGIYEELLNRFPKAQGWELAELLSR